jgi:lipopolysaccharide assembly outer membrane protein LptD (OstA)
MSAMHRPILLLALSFAGILLYAQEEKKIEILNSEYMEYDARVGTGVVKYVGEVAFQQQNMLLSCDSAWYFARENNVHAYGNVHIIQGDTLNLYGDELRYFGNDKFAEMRHNVTLIDKETTLTTDYLDFDLENNVGYYERHGHIINGENTLDSRAGYYYSQTKSLNFRDSVVIVNPEYTIYADTLKYHTVSEIAYFLGPTRIISPENSIYCENGWYDTQKNISQFNKNAYLESDGQYLRGDSL